MRYYQWTENGYHNSGALMSNEQIRILLRYHNRREEAYASIQDYDSDGNIIGCFLYFDIDNSNLADAYSTMIDTVFQIEELYDCKCLVYFSGSKGFHIIAPVYILHSRCHDIVKMIVLKHKLDVDMSVYRNKSWFRCAGTWNPKGKRYKTLAERNDTLEDLLHKSKTKQRAVAQEFNRVDIDITSYIEKLPDINVMASDYGRDFVRDMHPCMRKIWAADAPPEGQAHWFLNIMARHCYRSDLSIQEAESVFADHHFWSTVKERDYKKVIASIYRSGKSSIGCKSGMDADLLKDFCSKLCMFNDDVSIFDLFNEGKE